MAHHQHQDDTGSEDELEHRHDSDVQQPRPGPRRSPTRAFERAQTVLRWGRSVVTVVELIRNITQAWPWSWPWA